MSLTKPAVQTAPEDPPEKHGDERVVHRGPMRRWLISPEIGALIGAVVVLGNSRNAASRVAASTAAKSPLPKMAADAATAAAVAAAP